MPTHQHVNAGERLKIPANTYNAMVDAANAHARTARSITPGDRLPPLLPGQIYVKNTTSTTLKRHDILVASSLTSATSAKSNRLESAHNIRTEPVVNGITPVPDSATHAARILVLDAPAPPNKIVAAYVSGVCVARLEYTSGNGEAADIDNSFRLKNVETGPVRIIALGEDNPERLALVELSPFGTFKTMVVEIEATDTQLRYKTQRFRVIGEKDPSEWITLLEWGDCEDTEDPSPDDPLTPDDPPPDTP